MRSPSSRRDRLDSFRRRRVGIVGLGREGSDLARFLTALGAEVTVNDRGSAEALAEAMTSLSGLDIRYSLGHQDGSELLHCEEIFVSPGVPASSPAAAVPAAHGIPLSSATALFFELCSGPIVGVTGSSGKTTTTSLTGSIFREWGVQSIVGGNIGVPMLNRLAEITPRTWSVLELSSFQLADLRCSPNIGAILNITPNHLDRHPDMEDYVRAKANIIGHQHPEDSAVLNADDPIVASLPHASRTVQFSLKGPVPHGSWLDRGLLRLSDSPDPLIERSEIPLRGLHNVANVLAAAAISRAAGSPPGAIANAIRRFKPVPHRLETVATVDGVDYVNDSIATSPERSSAALLAIDTPIVLIAGGRDKHLPMADWAQLIVERARAVVLVGEAAPLIADAVAATGRDVAIARAHSFGETVPLARSFARPGDTVLLSPGGTSFDEFRDYEARGEAFRQAVRALAGEEV